jgi:hypothetical protein
MVTAKSIVSFAHPTVFPSGTGDALRKNKDKTAANANNFDAWTPTLHRLRYGKADSLNKVIF